jgi:hypothetical protein
MAVATTLHTTVYKFNVAAPPAVIMMTQNTAMSEASSAYSIELTPFSSRHSWLTRDVNKIGSPRFGKEEGWATQPSHSFLLNR